MQRYLTIIDSLRPKQLLSSHFVVPDVVQDGSFPVTLGQKTLTFVSTIFCFLDEKLKLLKIRRDLVEISPNLQQF